MKRFAVGISLVLVVLTLASFISGQAQKAAGDPALLPAGNGAPPLSNPLKVALLKWYNANKVPTEFPVGKEPEGVAFDGANIWTANFGDGTVSKVRASDGAILGTFTVGGSPIGIVF